MAGRLPLLILVLTVLLAPLAAALPGEGRVLAERELVLEGDLRGSLRSGGFALLEPTRASLDGSAAVVNVSLQSVRELRVRDPLTGGVNYVREDATEWFEAQAAPVALRDVGPTARFLVHGDALDADVVLDGAVLRGYGERNLVPVAHPHVDGRNRVAFHYTPTDVVTADAPSGAIALRGDGLLYVWDATLVVAGQELRTGVFDETRAGALPLETVTEKRYVWAVVRVEGADLALAGDHAVVAGDAVWRLDGTVRADRARADFDVDGVRRAARDASFRLQGVVDVEPQRVPDADAPRAFDAEGPDARVAASVRGDVLRLSAGPAEATDPRLLQGAAAAGGAAALAFLGWALYTRLRSPGLLDNGVRAEIYRIVCENPGIGAREIHRKAGRSWGTVVYHLRQLEKHNLVKSKRFGRLRNFYENHGKWGGQETMLAALKGDKTLEIARLIVDRPGLHQDALVDATTLPQSTVSYRVKRLREAGLVEERREARFSAYFPTPDLVRLLRLRGEAAADAAAVAGAGPSGTA